MNRYPLRDSEACRAAPDGYCELADLHRYETNDGACLTVEGGQTWDHLFYRSAGTGMQSAVAVERVNGAWQATNRSLQAPVGGRYYIHRSPVGAQTPTVAARIDVPAVSQSAVFPTANSATTAAIRSELSGLLRSGGLSEDEAMAFEGAWFAELFENGHTGGAPLVEDAVLYVMPLADVDQISQLEFRPMPTAIRRVFWMRIIL